MWTEVKKIYAELLPIKAQHNTVTKSAQKSWKKGKSSGVVWVLAKDKRLTIHQIHKKTQTS